MNKKNVIKAAGILFFAVALLCMSYEYNIWNDNVSPVSGVIKENKDDRKVAYLTFDDGPSLLSSKYLDILKEEDVKATFFFIGQQICDDMEGIVKRAIDEGNEIGVHTYCHEACSIYKCSDAYYRDIMKTKKLLEDKFKYKPVLFRFPWGSANNYIASYRDDIILRLGKEGMEYQDWNVSAEDSVGSPTINSILNNIRKDYKKYNEPVILMHDSGCNEKTLAALKEVIRDLKKSGYSFATLSQRSKPCHFYEH